MQLVAEHLNWLPGSHLDQIQAEQKLEMSELEKQVILSELQSGFDLPQIWQCYPGQYLAVAPEIAHQDNFVHVPAPGDAQSELRIYCIELETHHTNM